jgi:hypothetical protein
MSLESAIETSKRRRDSATHIGMFIPAPGELLLMLISTPEGVSHRGLPVGKPF